uniref:Opsin 6, group member a n=1 Tax=Poecilia latipinna TaxID=48699 RepID=A0A3B3V944_9TELE
MSLSNATGPGPGPAWKNHSFSTGEGRDPPLSDQGETIIGVYLLLLGWMSWFGNSIVLFVLLRQRASLQPTDYLTFNLAVSDASISVFGYSRGIIEIFNVFQDSSHLVSSIWTCQVDGFFTLVFGLSSIYTLTVISFTRYIKGCHPNRAHRITRSSVFVSLLYIWVTAGFWSAAPLLGWGSYTVLIMLFCYVSIINTVKRGNALSANGDLTDRQRKIERDVTIVSIVICTAFILAWSPYAVVSMWSACGFHVPNLTSIFTRLFAKSASFYNPLIYFGLSSKFRKDVAILLPCTQNAKDAVRLKRFRPKAEGHGRRTTGGARFKGPLNHSENNYSPMNQSPQAASPGSGKEMPPPGTSPADAKEVFFINMAAAHEASSEFECVRL